MNYIGTTMSLTAHLQLLSSPTLDFLGVSRGGRDSYCHGQPERTSQTGSLLTGFAIETDSLCQIWAFYGHKKEVWIIKSRARSKLLQSQGVWISDYFGLHASSCQLPVQDNPIQQSQPRRANTHQHQPPTGYSQKEKWRRGGVKCKIVTCSSDVLGSEPTSVNEKVFG